MSRPSNYTGGAGSTVERKKIDPTHVVIITHPYDPSIDSGGEIYEGTWASCAAYDSAETAYAKAEELAKNKPNSVARVFKLDRTYRSDLPLTMTIA